MQKQLFTAAQEQLKAQEGALRLAEAREARQDMEQEAALRAEELASKAKVKAQKAEAARLKTVQRKKQLASLAA